MVFLQQDWCVNGKALEGLTGWTTSNVSVIADVFALLSNGSMSQTHTFSTPIAFPDDPLAFQFDYKIDDVLNVYEPEATIKVTALITYSDGTHDAVIFPIKPDAAGWVAAYGEFSSDGEKMVSTVNLRVSTGIVTAPFLIDNIGFGLKSLFLNEYIELNKMYHGIKITEELGLEATRDDLMARAYFNSDTLAFQKGNGAGSWTNQLYYDTNTATFVFDGTLSAGVVNVLESLIVPNLYADKANIAELTVDRLQTHDKIQRYLNNDQSDVHWINIQDQYIEFVTSEDCTGSYENVYSRHGEQLFWKDGTHTHVTTENTGLPVRQFEYDKELVKLSLMFESDGSNQVPMIALGAGTGISGDKDGRGFIYKDDGGLYIEYHTYGSGSTPNDGEVRRLGLSESRIDFSDFGEIVFSQTVVLEGVTQVWVQEEVPVGMKANDVWIDSNNYSTYENEHYTEEIEVFAEDPEFLTFDFETETEVTFTCEDLGVLKIFSNIGLTPFKVRLGVTGTLYQTAVTGVTIYEDVDGPYFNVFPGECISVITI